MWYQDGVADLIASERHYQQRALFKPHVHLTRPLKAHRRGAELCTRVDRALRYFPELEHSRITVGVTRIADGVAILEDMTVRTKGVMEKCTFCIQRIKRVRDRANDEGRLIADGEIVPACVQTCPTKALTFGNLSDENSKVAKQAMRGRGAKEKRLRQYEVLEELANLPGVTYLLVRSLNSSLGKVRGI